MHEFDANRRLLAAEPKLFKAKYINTKTTRQQSGQLPCCDPTPGTYRAMRLLDLPTEILILIFEDIADVRTLYDLTCTCRYARNVFAKNSPTISDQVVANAYPEYIDVVKEILDARLSVGELDYRYQEGLRLEWIYPDAVKAYPETGEPAGRSLARLKNLTNFINDSENITEWCLPRCRQKSSWSCSAKDSLRESVLEALLQLQLASNRLYNVRLPTFPEQVSLRTFESDRTRFFISRKTRDQATDLMQDQLRHLDTPSLRNLWMLVQILQDEYQLLRRHRLRPARGSLMELLFEHDLDANLWSISPWFAVQNLLSGRGVHVVPARPGTAFRFLGHETTHELQGKDVADFDHFTEALCSGTVERQGAQQCRICVECDSSLDGCAHDYLESFRPLLGIPYKDATPAKDLVRFRGSMQPMIVANCYWANESTTKIDQTPLGKMLWECAKSNSTIEAAKRRNSAKPVRGAASGSKAWRGERNEIIQATRSDVRLSQEQLSQRRHDFLVLRHSLNSAESPGIIYPKPLCRR